MCISHTCIIAENYKIGLYEPWLVAIFTFATKNAILVPITENVERVAPKTSLLQFAELYVTLNVGQKDAAKSW